MKTSTSFGPFFAQFALASTLGDGTALTVSLEGEVTMREIGDEPSKPSGIAVFSVFNGQPEPTIVSARPLSERDYDELFDAIRACQLPPYKHFKFGGEATDTVLAVRTPTRVGEIDVTDLKAGWTITFDNDCTGLAAGVDANGVQVERTATMQLLAT